MYYPGHSYVPFLNFHERSRTFRNVPEIQEIFLKFSWNSRKFWKISRKILEFLEIFIKFSWKFPEFLENFMKISWKFKFHENFKKCMKFSWNFQEIQEIFLKHFFQETFERSWRFLNVQELSRREHVNVQGSTKY